MVKTSGWSLPEPRAQGPPFLTKSQIAAALEQVAVLLELDGANRFRVIAYQNASRALASLEEDLLTVVKEGRITDVKGIGKGLGGLIDEAVMEGTWGDLPSLYEKIPPGLMQIVEIPGLGPKRARTMYEELGVDSVESLKVACEMGHVAPLTGFGEKSQQKYLEGIELLRRYQGRSRMDVGLLYGRSLEDKISSMPGVKLAQLAGSARRRRETIGDLDIVVGADPKDHDSVIQSILGLSGIAEVKGHGESKVSLILESNVLGDSLGESSMDAAKHTLLCSTEEDIYAHLGMNWIPPELREDTGEIEAASEEGPGLPRLIEPSDIRGALHNHTIASDGTATLEEMASAAMNLGWEYLGIADHSEVLNIGGRQIGVPAANLASQGDSIRALNEKWKDSGQDFRLLHGSECDILVDGSLDYDDDTRNTLSHIIGSVHALGSWRNRDELTNTEALIRAIEDPTFTVLGHPTGRILQGREGFPVDMHAVLRRMGELNSEGQLKAVEINASPYRLDLDWRLCKYARDQGVPICINPDAHDTNGLRDYWYGVQIARKGWLSAADVLNTRSGAEIETLLGI